MSYPLPLIYGPTHPALATFDPEFDTVYAMAPDGAILNPGHDPYLPNVQNYADGDVLIDYATPSDAPGAWSAWSALTGFTGQHGYRGAVMHPSEHWGRWATDELERLTGQDDAPDGTYILFGIVECLDDDGNYPDGDAIGWVVVYKLVTPETSA